MFEITRSDNGQTWWILDPTGVPLRTRCGSRRRAWSTSVSAREMARRLNALQFACPLIRRRALLDLGVREKK